MENSFLKRSAASFLVLRGDHLRIFRATGPRWGSAASQTTPPPPSESLRSSRYLPPMTVPAWGISGKASPIIIG